MTTGETRLISLNTTTHLIKSELKRRGGGRGGRLHYQLALSLCRLNKLYRFLLYTEKPVALWILQVYRVSNLLRVI